MINVEKLVTHQCRTCYNSTKGLKLLKTIAKCSGNQQQKTYAELLKEVAKINIMEDYSKDLPQLICESCSRKLKVAHAFIQQTHEVNERLMVMLRQPEEINNHSDCLQEAPVDIQSCLEIKMEDDDGVDGTENEAQCHVDLKEEESEEFPPLNKLKVEKMSGKKESDEENSLELSTLNVMNISNCSLNESKSEYNEDMLNMDSVIEDDNSISHTESLKEDNENNDTDEDYKDNQSEDEKEEKTIQNPKSKKAEKKINKKSKRSEKKPVEDDDVAVPCSQCNKIFNNSKALTRHQRTSHIPEDQKCTCPLCFRKFSKSCNMYTHMRSFHGPETVLPFLHKRTTDERIFQCDKCPRNYTQKKQLNRHIKNKHSQESEEKAKDANKSTDEIKPNNDNEDDDHVNTKPKKPKRYEVPSLCSICGSSFSSKTQLIVHMRRHTGERPFKCDLCDRAFPRISELTCHRRIHTGEKPFACKICGKTFRVSSKMTAHMRSHTDIRPYKCTQCERSFKYSRDLSTHFRIHTGERPYCCNVCGSTFTQSNTLKAHRVKLGHMDNVMQNINLNSNYFIIKEI